MKDMIKQKKLTTTKKNCKKTKDIILVSINLISLKFLIEKKTIKIDIKELITRELYPIKFTTIYFSSKAALTSGGI